MFHVSRFSNGCRVCFKPSPNCSIFSQVQSAIDGVCLTYEELLNELSFVPKQEHVNEIPSSLCTECVRRLDEYLFLKQQTLLILKISIALVDVKRTADSQAIVDLFQAEGDLLKKCLLRFNVDFPLEDFLKDESNHLKRDAVKKKEETESEPKEGLKIEEVQVEQLFVPSSPQSLGSCTDRSEPELESEDDEPLTKRRKRKQKIKSKSSSKIIRRDGVRYKLCVLTGCEEEYEVGNRAAYLEHEKLFHRYACNLCGRVLASRTSFRNHVLLHDGEEAKVKCDFCERTFTTKGSMMVHVREVHNNTGIHFNCQYCGLGFMEQKDLYAHLHEHRQCKICDEKFSDLNGWINHNRRQHPDTLFTCELCDHTSLSPALLDRHKRMKHSENCNDHKPQRFTIYAMNNATFHQCPQCNLQFTAENFLLQHNEQTHNRPQVEKHGRLMIKRRSREEREKFALRYSCDVCGKMYRFKNSLWSHKHKEHSIAKNAAICDVCGQNFKHQSYLTAHIANKHATELPFQCEHCSKAYSQAYLLKEHMKSHDSEKRHKCPHCTYRAKQSHALKDHVIRMHTSERPVKCAECDKGFINNNDLRKHMAVHNAETPFKCEECDHEFRRKMDLGRHRSRVHLAIVGRKREEVSFQCDGCELTFWRKMALTKHRNKVHSERVERREVKQIGPQPEPSSVEQRQPALAFPANSS